MQSLLRVSRAIDAVSTKVGVATGWLILASVLISAGNAVMRYSIKWSSNAWLEIQWYLYSAVFLLCAAYTLLRNEHIRIDIIAGSLSPRTQAWIDVFGTVLFLLPMSIVLAWLSWPMFVESYVRNEISSDAGGLLRWPVKLVVPIGFALLTLQGVSELIKRIAFLRGLIPDPAGRRDTPALEPLTAEQK